MPIPLIAAIAGKAGTAAKAAKIAQAASTASKAAKAAQVAKAAKTASTASKLGKAASTGKKQLSLSMLADDKVNTYPGTKPRFDKFKEKAGKVMEGMGKQDTQEFEEPTTFETVNPTYPTNTNAVYSEQIQKLKNLR